MIQYPIVLDPTLHGHKQKPVIKTENEVLTIRNPETGRYYNIDLSPFSGLAQVRQEKKKTHVPRKKGSGRGGRPPGDSKYGHDTMKVGDTVTVPATNYATIRRIRSVVHLYGQRSGTGNKYLTRQLPGKLQITRIQ